MQQSQRFDSVDALRGLALVWMTLYHLGFDLNHFGWWHQDFYRDAIWTSQRTAIVSLFLFCAGLGQALAHQQGMAWDRFARRWIQVAGCAVLVSAGSWWMFPQSYIYFGVLHGITLMLLVARLTAGWGAWLWGLGGLCVMTPWLLAPALVDYPTLAHALNSKWWNWLGLITHKPITEDYVPLLPWLGVVWWGMATGQGLQRWCPQFLGRPLPGTLQPLATLGRWSLSWYMLHQPLLMGLLMAASAWVR